MSEMPDDFTEFKESILWELRYEDDEGVYEVWWSANTRYPLLAVSERLRIAEHVVKELLLSGEAALYRQMPLEPDSRSEIEDQMATLGEVTTWVPFDGKQVWIEAASVPTA